jgi:hypothetical protein
MLFNMTMLNCAANLNFILKSSFEKNMFFNRKPSGFTVEELSE